MKLRFWLFLSSFGCLTEIYNPLAVDNDGDGYSELQGDCDDSEDDLLSSEDDEQDVQ